jgi:hypothetical protein
MSMNQKHELTGLAHFFEKKYSKAASQFEKQYRILCDAQKDEGRSIHKGAPLHNWALSLLLEGYNEKGTQEAVAAYIEDLLTTGLERSRDSLASKLLSELGVDDDQKKEIDRIVRSVEKQVGDIRDTEAIVSDVVGIRNGKVQVLNSEVKMPSSIVLANYGIALSGDRDKRVFVGGSYRNIALLIEICRIIDDIDSYVGILAERYLKGVPKKIVRKVCNAMLDHCSYAFFEISFTNGHMMEIEHCHNILEDNKQIDVMLAWQVVEHTRNIDDDPPISQMLLADEFLKVDYRNLTELGIELNKFLPH